VLVVARGALLQAGTDEYLLAVQEDFDTKSLVVLRWSGRAFDQIAENRSELSFNYDWQLKPRAVARFRLRDGRDLLLACGETSQREDACHTTTSRCQSLDAKHPKAKPTVEFDFESSSDEDCVSSTGSMEVETPRSAGSAPALLSAPSRVVVTVKEHWTPHPEHRCPHIGDEAQKCQVQERRVATRYELAFDGQKLVVERKTVAKDGR
jgi:hypothetical protein